MKNIIRISVLLLLSCSLFSCEKVIDVKLNDSDSKYVVEGVVTPEAGSCKVTISQTKNFTENNNFIGISGAQVIIESKGVSTPLTDMGNGVYQSDAIIGTSGTTYNLSVKFKDQVFTASSTMPQSVTLDSMYIKSGDFDSKRTPVTIRYKDPAGVSNYYFFEKYINKTRVKGFTLANDEFSDGQSTTQFLVFEYEKDSNGNRPELKKGDDLIAVMHCVDASVYAYLAGLQNASGSDGGIAPANPISNIKGGALGYFSAHTVFRKAIKVP